METLTNIDLERTVENIGWIGVGTMVVGMVINVYSLRLLGATLAGVGLVGTLYYYFANRE